MNDIQRLKELRTYRSKPVAKIDQGESHGLEIFRF